LTSDPLRAGSPGIPLPLIPLPDIFTTEMPDCGTVIVNNPPSGTSVPLMFIELFCRALFGMLVSAAPLPLNEAVMLVNDILSFRVNGLPLVPSPCRLPLEDTEDIIPLT